MTRHAFTLDDSHVPDDYLEWLRIWETLRKYHHRRAYWRDIVSWEPLLIALATVLAALCIGLLLGVR